MDDKIAQTIKLLIFSWIIFSCCLITSTSWAIESVSELVLDNGLKVIVKPDRRSPIAILQVWYKVGSSYEQKGTTGVSHMLEHLMFKGSENWVLQEGFNRLNNIGARGNAYTHRDYTFYYHMLEKEHLEVSFKVEAQRMKAIAPTMEDFEIEKKVILEELHTRMTKDPHLFSYEALYEQAFDQSGYRLPVIGFPEDIEALTLSATMDWYNRFYRPDNAIMVVAGDVNEDEVFALVRKHFSDIKKIKSSVKNTANIIDSKQEKTIHYVIPETTQVGLLLMGFKVPSIKSAVPSWEAYALDVLAGWFESGHNSRLSKALIRDTKQAYEISVSYSIMRRQDTLFIIEAIPSQGTTLNNLENILNEEIKKVKSELISNKTLRKIKNQMIATEVYERDSLYTQAKIIGQAEVIGIPWQQDAQYIKRIKAVTPEQIQAVLKKYFVMENKVIVIQNSYNHSE